MASDEEVLAGKRFDPLDAGELAQLYRLMSRLGWRPRCGARAATSEGATGIIDLRRSLRGSLRTGGEPIRLAHRRRRVARRRLVMLCDISGSMEPYARAYLQFLDLRRRQRAERRGVRLRDAADPPDPRARGAPSRARDPARRARRRTGRAAPGSATR